VGGGTFAIVRQRGAVGIASTSRAAARARGRAAFRYLRGATYWLAVAVAAVALVAVLASVGARLFGYSPYVMYGGSMGSTARMGSVAFIEDAPAESLHVGDVIVFRPPSSGQARQPVMHRIISIEEADGQRVLRTKGDANESADPWELRLMGEGGRLVFVVPYAGYPFWFFQTRTAWAFVVLPLTAYVGFVALRRIWVSGGRREAERTQAR
jgi:signal peptidase